MSRAKRESKWPWRDYLSSDEAALIAEVEAAKARWLEQNMSRASIKNRAVQRAMYDASSKRQPS
jgi:hypothetical protein